MTTIPAPPPGAADPAEMVKVELELLREQRDAAIRMNARAQRQIHDLQNELEKLKGRHGHF
jgi:FtsZ-binding cell division protein ZapB